MAGPSMSRSINQAVRAMAQAQREHERAQRRAYAEQERARKAAEKASKAEYAANERERKRLYLEARQAECDLQNADLALRLDDLESLLSATLSKDDYIHLPYLKKTFDASTFNPGSLGIPKQAPLWSSYEPQAPSGFGKLFGGSRYKKDLDVAKKAFDSDTHVHIVEEESRKQQLQFAEDQFLQQQAEQNDSARSHNAQIDALMTGLSIGEPAAICQYLEVVLEKSVYPLDFPQHFRIAYVPESKHLVCEYELPGIGVVPAAKSYKYIKTQDKIASTARAAKEIRIIYASILAQIPIRTVHELLEADRSGFINTVTFNGMLEAINPSTGRLIRSCVVSFRTSRAQFEELDLAQVDPIACLRSLNAAVSKSPDELVAVKPVVEFNMVDQRFVNETDVLSELDERPNLLDLTPGEFESLIQNLFSRMGLETKLTRASRDGGVDCVAYDSRPIFGGKVVIQAKRYKNTVDVSAVRDLFGSMQNEGANKGILVATSGYGPTAYEFAQGKPLELIDGSGLLHLLAEHAELNARIVVAG